MNLSKPKCLKFHSRGFRRFWSDFGAGSLVRPPLAGVLQTVRAEPKRQQFGDPETIVSVPSPLDEITSTSAQLRRLKIDWRHRAG